jgi:uncharacterized protein
MKRLFLFVVCCFVCCASSESQELTKIEPIIISSPQNSNMLMAEIADTDELRGKGLMFRHIMPVDRAMLFDFIKPRPAAMWMKNTYMSLDMLFVREDGSIAAIAENTVPKSLDTISVQEPVRSVIELAAGTVKRLNIHQNDVVFHRIFKTKEE